MKRIIAILLIAGLMLSGCINMEVSQKIKRSGNLDMELSISTSQEYKMILNSLNEQMEVAEPYKGKFQYDEDETSVTYSFKDIKPEDTANLFVLKNQTEVAGEDIDMGMLPQESFTLTKEFRFPYYVYTYNMSIGQEEPEVGNYELEMEDYVRDEANMISPQNREQILEFSEQLLNEQDLELIIQTRTQMNTMDFYSYTSKLQSEFDFKGSGNYILILASRNEDGVCRVYTNVFTDSEVRNKVTSINSNFQSCRDNTETQILNAVRQLRTFFATHEFNDDAMQQGLDEIFKIGYVVEVFGKVTDTSGRQMDGNRVKFEVSPMAEQDYTIEYRDFFLATWLGDKWWLYFVLVVVAIIVGYEYMHHKKRGDFKEKTELQAPLAVPPELVDYVRHARNSGLEKADIIGKLKDAGWSNKEIEVALKS